jgi:hypothetical protein
MKTIDQLPRLISLSGKSGSGKDTVAQILADAYGYKRVAIADPIKQYVAELFELTEEQLWGNFRNQLDERLQLAPREIYQRFGDSCREIDSRVWIRKWRHAVEERLETGQLVVCTDVRTPAELECVRKMGGVCWLIERAVAGAPREMGEHATERALTEGRSKCFDEVICNDGTLDDLEKEVIRQAAGSR